jgi:hypothetical protein
MTEALQSAIDYLFVALAAKLVWRICQQQSRLSTDHGNGRHDADQPVE